ncbi:MAG: UDP-N-acetylglucosamine--N-acetylmuramyl-(pentapeptide) pyrophosphoryl-undecaprenol N-acetylglucosamine transferase [Sphaerochaetaceae bacterium]|jgi:UDP-N-acetylglucosamine--N-acetylmuramyl-(pentapeptide) pyrophosphoryl-undecaprenol N-acetylglucosamine transferase
MIAPVYWVKYTKVNQRRYVVKICYTGGGSAGHIFPLFPVDTLIQKNHPTITRFWIGRESIQEQQWIEDQHISFFPIKTGKLRRYLSLLTLRDALYVLIGFIQALTILHKKRADVVLSKGGYVSVPVIWAAKILNIPVISHESDLTPGLATTMSFHVATYICIPFEESKQYYPPKVQHKLIVTGVPSRFVYNRSSVTEIEKRYHLQEDSPLLVVLGGSLGSLDLNSLIWENIESLSEKATIVHQTGDHPIPPLNNSKYYPISFITEELEALLQRSTLVFSRSGATALADYAAMRVPMLLYPLSKKASRGDQIENALFLEKHGAAEVLHSPHLFIEQLTTLLGDSELRSHMVQQCSLLYIQDGETHIVDVVYRVLGLI